MKRLLTVICCAALLIPSGISRGRYMNIPNEVPSYSQQTEDGNWFVAIDMTNTPLAKEIKNTHDVKEGKDKRSHKWEEKKNKKDPTGHVVETETILEYENAEGFPDDGDGKGKTQGGQWKPIKMKPEGKENKDWKTAGIQPSTYNKNRDTEETGPKVYSAFLPNTEDNDDDDCLDLATGKHLRGIFDDSEGIITGCFIDPENDRQLGQTLYKVDLGDGSIACQHKEDHNIIFSEEECDERGMTTLVEVIDEDGMEDLDFDGDGNLDDNDADGENDDDDCVDISGTHFQGDMCKDEQGIYFEGKYPLIDEDGTGQIDNDGDGLTNEDGPGSSAIVSLLTVPEQDRFKAQCKDFYKQVESQLNMSDGELFTEEDLDNSFDDDTGECDFDNAVIKGINKVAEKEHGKRVFKDPKDPNPEKEKWDDSDSKTGQEISYTFSKKGNYTVLLTVTDNSGVTSACSQRWKVDDKGAGKLLKSDCPSDTPSPPAADFTVNCTGLECGFNASGSSGEGLGYNWTIGKKAAGDDVKSQGTNVAFDKGKERRKVTVTETMVVHCQPGWIYEEDPTSPDDAKKIRCRKMTPVQTVAGQNELVMMAGLPVNQSQLLLPSNKAMMGITFAPPVIEWGWKIEEEVCIFGWCFEIFYARVGYEFDIAAGLRLPVQMDLVEVSDNSWPDDVWAENSYDFKASLTPLDFDKQDYIQFCQDHELYKEWYISDCERFAFPDFLDDTDGDEFVANYEIFAGIIVRVLSIPLIHWAIESSYDLAQSCTLFNALMALPEADLQDLAQIGSAIANGEMADTLKDMGILCGSFTTPFGFDEEGERRTFPFPMFSYAIRADCAEAIARKEIIVVGGEPVPLCTGLILGVHGASLGIGLELETWASSEHICANWGANGDATRQPGSSLGCEDPLYGVDRDLDWAWEEGQSSPPVVDIGPVIYDNYDLGWSSVHDKGIVEVDDFVYWLDVGVSLYANLMFGGILSPIPDLKRFEIYTLSFTDTGAKGVLPIPQHPGTEPLKFSVDVKNHGVDVTNNQGPVSVPKDGGPFEGWFALDITNVGSLPGTFGNFRVDLTNIAQPPGSQYVYDHDDDQDHDGQTNEDELDNSNNDHDCLDLNGNHFRDDDCFDASGQLKADLFELIDEDPSGGEWTYNFVAPSATSALNPYESKLFDDALVVYPYPHPMTKPGLYPVKILVDSLGALNRMDNWDMLFPAYYGPYVPTVDHRESRWDAYHVVFVKIEKFYKPDVVIEPIQDQARPGITVEYKGTFRNAGNAIDTILAGVDMVDFNQGNCTLTTLGKSPDCPYRAVPTYIPAEWVLDGFTGSYGPLPGGTALAPSLFKVTAPSDWTGMEDTPYEFIVTGLSSEDINASDTETVVYTVEATLESRTRYIIAEINELITEIEAANAQGIKTCGLYPVSIHPVSLQSQRALSLILAGKPDQALNALSANLHIMQGAFMRGLTGCKGVPDDPWRTDWMQRGQAIIDDLILTTTSQ